MTVDNRPKRSVWSRSSRLAAMAARVASKELGHTVRKRFRGEKQGLAAELRTRIEQAQIITDNLSKLKGAAMKAGQLLSIDAGDLLPEEASSILARLQGEAEPVDFAVMKQVLHEELGDRKIEQLVDLNPNPAAAASIGQVHRATVDGRSVAVKIQYPGIAESIDSDVDVLETIARSFLTLSGKKITVDQTLDEIRLVLRLEADYRNEASNMHAYRLHLKGDERFVVPSVIESLCSTRVLTMTWHDGTPLKTWLKRQPSPEARSRLARSILDLYCREFFEWGLVQTDPNPGNYLIDDDGRIVLLDFGAALRYDEAFRRGYVKLLKAIATGDEYATVETGIDFGLLDPREGPEARKAFAAMLFNSMEPFEAGRQPFVFRDEDYMKRAKQVGGHFIRSLQYSPPPRKLIFLHRKLGGIFQLLRRLDVSLDLLPYWQRMVEGKPHAPARTRAA